MQRFQLAAFVLGIGIIAMLAGRACTVGIGYTRPTNYELVKDADAIVLANAIAFEKKSDLERGKSRGIFTFKVLERIKGDCTNQLITVEGDDDLQSWGDPDDFSFAKGDTGMCNPTDYKLKGNYALFLENWKGKWMVGGAPFTRVNVLVEGTNAPWTKAVRYYARIAALNDYEKEKAALHDLYSRAMSEDRYPENLASDIDAHFEKPTPAKSFADLRKLYDRATDSGTRERVLWACAVGGKKEAGDFFRQLIETGDWKKYQLPVCSYVARVKLSGVFDVLATTLRNSRNENERQRVLMALAGCALPSEQASMVRLLESLNKEEADVLTDWFEKNPSPEAITVFTKLVDKDYPENFEFTKALAGMGDTNVFNWAKEFVKQPGDKAWMGYYVFARSPLPAADEMARQVIQRGDSEELIWLVQGYQDSLSPDRTERIKNAIALKTKSQKLIFWLRRTLGDWADNGDKQAESLLTQLPVVESE
jgi:hypothetical protein